MPKQKPKLTMFPVERSIILTLSSPFNKEMSAGGLSFNVVL